MNCIASALAMQCGELGRRHSLATAVGPDLVVVLAPECDGRPGLLQRLEPLLVEALVPEFAIEAFDVAVLHRPPWLDQDVADTMGLRPAHEGAACELRTVVRAHGQRVAPEDRRLIEQPRDVLPRDAPVHRDAHALMAEVIGDRQALDASPGAQAVADEVHAPYLIDRAGRLQRHTFAGRSLDLPAFAHCQIGRAIQPVDLLVVHARKVRAQHVVDAPVAKSSTRMGNLDDLAAQSLRHGIGLWWMAIAVAGEPHKFAGAPLAQIALLDHGGDGCALGLWG